MDTTAFRNGVARSFDSREPVRKNMLFFQKYSKFWWFSKIWFSISKFSFKSHRRKGHLGNSSSKCWKPGSRGLPKNGYRLEALFVPGVAVQKREIAPQRLKRTNAAEVLSAEGAALHESNLKL
jgi:hypothetical protein